MTTTAIKQVNSKLKNLPDTFVEEIEKYIDFLTFRHTEEESIVPNWQKEIVLQRIKDKKPPIDAFEMLKELEEI